MTPKKIKELRHMLGRTQEGMAEIIGTSKVTWGRWERGEHPPLKIFCEKLEKLWAFAKKQEEENGLL